MGTLQWREVAKEEEGRREGRREGRAVRWVVVAVGGTQGKGEGQHSLQADKENV